MREADLRTERLGQLRGAGTRRRGYGLLVNGNG